MVQMEQVVEEEVARITQHHFYLRVAVVQVSSS